MGRISKNVGRAGSHNGAWKSGISHKWAKHHKKDACERCGATRKLQIHHVDKDPKNNSPENIQTLCVPCHQYVHDNESRICIRCQTEFIGTNTTKRCIPCRKEYGREYRRKYYKNYDRTRSRGQRR